MTEGEVSRRRALGFLGLVFVGACGGASQHGSSAVAAHPSTTEATTTAVPETTVAPATTAPPVVAGSNKNITPEILAADAKGYNGNWTATWKFDTLGTTGTISGTAAIDPTARTFTARITVTGDLLHDGVAVPTFSVDGSVDSYTYGDDGSFSIHKATPVGDATMTSAGGMGSGQFHLKLVNIPAHPHVAVFEASGVANRAGVIPTTLAITFADGTKASGSCQFGQSGS
jgi:hypothetical protein